MNWEAISAVGEIVSAMVVALTLGYLPSSFAQQKTQQQILTV